MIRKQFLSICYMYLFHPDIIILLVYFVFHVFCIILIIIIICICYSFSFSVCFLFVEKFTLAHTLFVCVCVCVWNFNFSSWQFYVNTKSIGRNEKIPAYWLLCFHYVFHSLLKLFIVHNFMFRWRLSYVFLYPKFNYCILAHIYTCSFHSLYSIHLFNLCVYVCLCTYKNET